MGCVRVMAGGEAATGGQQLSECDRRSPTSPQVDGKTIKAQIWDTVCVLGSVGHLWECYPDMCEWGAAWVASTACCVWDGGSASHSRMCPALSVGGARTLPGYHQRVLPGGSGGSAGLRHHKSWCAEGTCLPCCGCAWRPSIS
jgi:hypothetical protein